MKQLLLILVLLARTVVPFPNQLHPNHFTRRLLNDVELGKNLTSPPKAKKVKHEMEMFGDVRVDNYFWLREDNFSNNPESTAYINEENNYTDLIMSDTKQLQDQIYAEIYEREHEDYIYAPRRRGPYYYYEKSPAGTYYKIYCRRLAPNGEEKPSVYDVMPTGPGSPPEHVILDEILRAQNQTYYRTGVFEVSPNHMLVVYTEDTIGQQNYTAYVLDVETRNPVGKSLVGLADKVVWAGNEAFIYITTDATQREDKVWLHKLGEEQSDDLCLYHEKDEKFSMKIDESESRKFVFVASESMTTRFVLYLDIANLEDGLIPLTPRIDGIATSVNHRGNHFFITRRSEDPYTSELLACPIANVSATTIILPHRESVQITVVQLFSNHLVVFERENWPTKVIIFDLSPIEEPIQMLQRAHAVEFMDPDYGVRQLDSEFSSTILRFKYGTLRTPDSVFDYDMDTRISVLKKINRVSRDFDSSNYFTERKWATASDGIQVPMSIVYKKDLKKLDGSNPLLMYSYGAYEAFVDPYFDAPVLSLLDRGFIYVIAHVRGGGEMGSQWHNDGNLLKKKNSFSDFIVCAEYLIEMKYCTNEKLVIDGNPDGGLVVGAVINMRPDLFKVAIAEAPFVDVVTSMLEETNLGPLEEFGDPHVEELYRYMKSYSPYDNISAQKYPSILVIGGNYRSLESVKYVAKLRDLKTDENLLLFKSENSSAITSWFSDDAFKFTFILKALDMLN